MTVVEAYVGRKKISPPEDYSQLQTEVSSLLHEGIAMNTTGSVFSSKDGKSTEVSESPTEKAILQWAVKSGMEFDNVRSECTVLHVSAECKLLSEEVFDFSRGEMTQQKIK